MLFTPDSAITFDNLVVGASNRLAAAAARAVAESPGDTYNPLFIYGDPGLGKTHLAAAIGLRVMEDQPDFRIGMTGGEELVERLNEAVAQGTLDAFTRSLQEYDLLIIDDVQFLAGHREVQSVLMRAFNVMQSRGKQLVLTSDRQPEDIPDVDQRLLSRLSGGLVADVSAPDLEMRLAILSTSALERGMSLAPAVLEEVARIAFSNVRELKGALNRLCAFSQLEGTSVAPEDVHAVLGQRTRPVRTPGAVAVLRADGSIAEYEDFFSDVAEEVAHSVEGWRLRIGEACERWQAEGYSVAVLERAMSLPEAPDVDGLLDTYAAAIAHLKELESMAATVDRTLEGNPVFRDPERVEEAEMLLAGATDALNLLPEPDHRLVRARIYTGSFNRLAMRTFDELLEEPGVRYNPFVLHGPSGSGKTLIANAFANEYRTRFPDAAIACTSAPLFMQELVMAMQDGSLEFWRSRYRRASLFVLDDLHFLSDKERTQDELFHLFNHLVSRRSQIILTSDRAPSQLTGFADRLRSRFGSGLVVELREPHFPEASALTEAALRGGAGDELPGAIGNESAAVAIAPRLHPGAPDELFLDTGKVILEWPELSGRLVEDLR